MSQVIEAGILRRLAAIFYDGLLVVAIWLVAGAVPLLFNRGEAVEPENPLMVLYLLAVTFLYFGWSWTRGGQTVGMRAWRLRLEQANGEQPNWKIALGRFLSALPAWALLVFGIALLRIPIPFSTATSDVIKTVWFVIACTWLIVDNWPRSWRERLTGTRVVVLSKEQQSAQSTHAP